MGLDFNASPYLQLWQQQQAQQAAQRPDPNAISQNIMAGLQGLADNRRQQQLLDLAEAKEGREVANQDRTAATAQREADYKYGTPIAPGSMFAQPGGVGKSSFMPGGQGQVAQGSNLIDGFAKWKADNMKGPAQPQYIEALGQDERKIFYDRPTPEAADLERRKTESDIRYKDAMSQRPATPESLILAGVDAQGNPLMVGNKTGEIRRTQIPGGGIMYPKTASDSQMNAGLFGKRASEANEQLNGLVQQGVDPTSYSLGVQSRLPNVLQSGNAQQLQQIKRNFVSAVLRKESGAAIADSEMANAERQYFPQAGDSPEVLRQKEINRQTAILGLNTAAGPLANPGGVPQGGDGLPGVGQTFNGGKVLRVTRIQ